MAEKTYDTILARMAGNIAGGLIAHYGGCGDPGWAAENSLSVAREILRQLKAERLAEIQAQADLGKNKEGLPRGPVGTTVAENSL